MSSMIQTIIVSELFPAAVSFVQLRSSCVGFRSRSLLDLAHKQLTQAANHGTVSFLISSIFAYLKA